MMAMEHETMKMTTKAAANAMRSVNVTARKQDEETTTSAAVTEEQDETTRAAAEEKHDEKTSTAATKEQDEKTTTNEETNMNATGTVEMQGAINLRSFRTEKKMDLGGTLEVTMMRPGELAASDGH